MSAELLAKAKRQNWSNFKQMCILLGGALIFLQPMSQGDGLIFSSLGHIYTFIGVVALLGGIIYFALLLIGLVLQAKIVRRRRQAEVK